MENNKLEKLKKIIKGKIEDELKLVFSFDEIKFFFENVKIQLVG